MFWGFVQLCPNTKMAANLKDVAEEIKPNTVEDLVRLTNQMKLTNYL